jgi:hypothetical protein
MTNPKAVGERSEGIVLGELIRLGCPVSLPFGNNQRYDLIVDEQGVLVRVQVKTAHWHEGSIMFKTSSVNGFTGKHRTYEGQADVFMSYSPHTDKVYRVPVSECGPSAVSLRVDPVSINRAKGIRWAKDYELACYYTQDKVA